MPGNEQHEGRGATPDSPGSPGTSPLSRRSLLGAAGVGAAGLAAGALGGIAAAAPAAAATTPASRAPGRGDSADGDQHAGSAGHVVVHLRSGNGGELDVFSGTSHTRVHDPDLAARLRRTIR
jgi:hypothetical protein